MTWTASAAQGPLRAAEERKEKGGGWLPDPPDPRDYTPDREEVRSLIARTGAVRPTAEALPASVDLREWCAPIEAQGPINSCTAHATCALLEYFERRGSGRYLDASRLFLYKVTRNLIGSFTDTGAYLRSAMGALRLIGVAPEKYWPYILTGVNVEPPPFCYALADNYTADVYYRLDPSTRPKAEVVEEIKTQLAAGLPSSFGFTAYLSILDPRLDGAIPLPALGEAVYETHAMAAVGYDDEMRIQNPAAGSIETVGALLVRNSWGTGWGQGGYGWLPYAYIELSLAQDFWVLAAARWIDTGAFDP
jgi:C1A family cysteine protease